MSSIEAIAGLKVMVIDDSNTIRRSAEIFLKQAGCEVVCVDNDRKDNTVNTRQDGPYKPYFLMSPNGGEFRGIPVPWSRHLYFADNWLARVPDATALATDAYPKHIDPKTDKAVQKGALHKNTGARKKAKAARIAAGAKSAA